MITKNRFNQLLENDNILTKEEEFDVFEYYNKHKTIDNKNKIALKNIKLIYKPSNEYARFGAEKEDLYQEAFLAVLHAIDKFDYTKGIKFSTYAYNWIESYLQKCTIDNQIIHVPFNVMWKIEKLKKLTKEYFEEKQVQPSDKYLQNALGVDSTELSLLRQYDLRVSTLSMEYEYYNGQGEVNTFYNYIADDNQDIDKLIDKIVYNDIINKDIQRVLSEDEFTIIAQRYGLNGNKPHSISELAEVYNISEQRMRLKIKQIQAKLRKDENLKKQILLNYT